MIKVYLLASQGLLIFDHGTIDGKPYYTMELLQRPMTLETIVALHRSGRLPSGMRALSSQRALVQHVVLPVARAISQVLLARGPGPTAEIEYSPCAWFALKARYAAIHFAGLPLRHAIGIAPALRFAERWELCGGVQFLRGGERENTLGMGGISFRF